MPVCAFVGCYSGSKKIKSSNTNVHIYRFPKDSHMRALWFEQIQKGSNETMNINFETAAVCSLHFSPSSYENKTRAQNILNYTPRRGRKLKRDAVPLSCECLETCMHGQNNSFNQSPKMCTPSGSFLVTNLADESTSIEPAVKRTCKISWTNFKSRGGLKLPSNNLMAAIKFLEIEFKLVNGDNITKSKGIMENMINRLTPIIQYLSIPHEVIDCLVRTRTFIRMNNLNKQLISDKYQKKS